MGYESWTAAHTKNAKMISWLRERIDFFINWIKGSKILSLV